MSNIVVRTVIVAALIAIIAFGTGVLLGPEWGWSLFSLALLGLLLHHARHLQLLRRWAGSTGASARGRRHQASTATTRNPVGGMKISGKVATTST